MFCVLVSEGPPGSEFSQTVGSLVKRGRIGLSVKASKANKEFVWVLVRGGKRDRFYRRNE